MRREAGLDGAGSRRDGSGATEQRRRVGTGLSTRTRKRSAQRAPASEGARDRDRDGEDRAAGFVEPGGAKPRPAE